jgi:hypothetical protein
MAAKPVYEDDAMNLSGFRHTSQLENDYPDQLTPLQSLGSSPGRKLETPDWNRWDSCSGVPTLVCFNRGVKLEFKGTEDHGNRGRNDSRRLLDIELRRSHSRYPRK